MPYLAEMPGFLDIFGVGMLSAWAFARLDALEVQCKARAATVASIVGVLWFVGLLRSYADASGTWGWPYVWKAQNHTFMAIALSLAVLGALLALPAYRRVFDNLPLRFFGAISYVLYLTHRPFARAVNARLDVLFPDDHSRVWVLVAVCALLATVLTYGFERPIMRWAHTRTWAFPHRRKAAAVAAAAAKEPARKAVAA